MRRRLILNVDPAGGVHLELLPRPLYIKVGVPRPRRLDMVTGPWQASKPAREEPTMSVQLQDDQEVDLTVEARDRAGAVVPNPGTLTWTVDDVNVLTLVTDPADQTKVTVRTTGVVGVATVTVSDDIDGDPATAEAVGSLSFEVVAGPVTQIVVNAGEPRAREIA